MAIKNAVITAATISNEDYGCLSVWLTLDYGGTGQGFGGFNLGNKTLKEFSKEGGNACGWFLNRCMAVADVTKWDDMVGKTIRVSSSHEKVDAIGHILKDDWFNPSKDFAGVE